MRGAAPNPRAETGLWLAQRASAAVLAVCVIVHLATIITVAQYGLSTADIVGRVGGNVGWAAFYGLFVVAAAIHAPIGVRTVLIETTPLATNWINMAAFTFAMALGILGLGAVFGLYGMGAAS